MEEIWKEKSSGKGCLEQEGKIQCSVIPEKKRQVLMQEYGRKSTAQIFIKKQKRLKLNELNKHSTKEIGKEPKSKPKETRRKHKYREGDVENTTNNHHNSNK